jgi:hypothetical protein
MDSGTVQNWHKDCRSYFNSMKYYVNFPKYERFKSGDMWPPVTAKTKDFPRPVIPVIRFIENHKVSNIINDPVKMIYSPDDQDEKDDMSEIAAELFTQYSKTEWENLEQDELNENAVNMAVNLGAGIWHYYWDNSVVVGKKRLSQGKLCGEVLDPINVYVGNPQDVNTQTQPFILITGRRDIDDIKKEAKANGISDVLIQEIKADKDTKDEAYDTTANEIKEKATVITAYWKEKGYVQLMKICGDVVIKQQTNTLKKLYPIVKMNWYKRNKCWYGQGETEGLIDNQKAINWMVAMQMKSGEATGMPKLMLKAGVTSWNNDPSQAVIDTTKDGSWGASYLQPSAISSHVPNLVDFLMENIKSLSGAGETSTGDIGSLSNISPTVVLSLQQQAQVPIESIKKRYKRAMKDIGEIWQEFWTVNYNTTRVIMIDMIDPNTVDPETGKGFIDPMTGQEIPPSESKQPQNFRGTDFANVNLKLKIDIGASQNFSDQLVTTSLDNLYNKKAIDTKTYVELYPESAMPYKNDLLKKLDANPNLGMPLQPNMPPQAPQIM